VNGGCFQNVAGLNIKQNEFREDDICIDNILTDIKDIQR